MKPRILILTFFLTLNCFSQQWRVFTTANSPLPSNNISGIVVDKNNVKWLGTPNGMVRIEGNNWQIFDTTNTPLGTNGIYPSALDSFNNIWCVLTSKGIAKFDSFNWTVFDTANSGLPSNSNASISTDKNNVKWIAIPGLIKFDNINWTLFNTTNSGLPSNVVTAVAIENYIKWIGTFTLSGGMAKFNDTNWVIYNTGNSQIPSNAINDIKIDYLGNKWICTYAGGLAKFNSEVNSWSIYNPSNSGISSYYIYCINFRNNYVKFIGTETNGISVFNDTTWQNFNTSNSPLPGDAIIWLEFDKFNNLWIGTMNGLAIYNPDGIIGINGQAFSTPKKFTLHQNFPNPFNPVTNIKYEIEKNGNVKLVIFDLTGREISIVVNQYQNIGIYTVTFDAGSLASGIYFYSLFINEKIMDTKKFVLIK